MANQGKPRWMSLALIGLVSVVALVEQIQLPFSPDVDAWLLGLWVLLFYGGVAVWITRNREALEREPRPLDYVGRPIIDPGIIEPEESEDKQGDPVIRPAPRSYRQSEAI